MRHKPSRQWLLISLPFLAAKNREISQGEGADSCFCSCRWETSSLAAGAGPCHCFIPGGAAGTVGSADCKAEPSRGAAVPRPITVVPFPPLPLPGMLPEPFPHGFSHPQAVPGCSCAEGRARSDLLQQDLEAAFWPESRFLLISRAGGRESCSSLDTESAEGREGGSFQPKPPRSCCPRGSLGDVCRSGCCALPVVGQLWKNPFSS